MSQNFGLILPVGNLDRSITFYSALGYPVEQRCAADRAICVRIGNGVEAILQTKDRFATLTAREIVDAERAVEAIVSLSLETRARVDELVDRAIVAGGRPAGETIDHGSFYRRGFVDLDGHQFAVECSHAASERRRPVARGEATASEMSPAPDGRLGGKQSTSRRTE
jgi:predicted lactoylglutathione lyase